MRVASSPARVERGATACDGTGRSLAFPSRGIVLPSPPGQSLRPPRGVTCPVLSRRPSCRGRSDLPQRVEVYDLRPGQRHRAQQLRPDAPRWLVVQKLPLGQPQRQIRGDEAQRGRGRRASPFRPRALPLFSPRIRRPGCSGRPPPDASSQGRGLLCQALWPGGPSGHPLRPRCTLPPPCRTLGAGGRELGLPTASCGARTADSSPPAPRFWRLKPARGCQGSQSPWEFSEGERARASLPRL